MLHEPGPCATQRVDVPRCVRDRHERGPRPHHCTVVRVPLTQVDRAETRLPRERPVAGHQSALRPEVVVPRSLLGEPAALRERGDPIGRAQALGRVIGEQHPALRSRGPDGDIPPAVLDGGRLDRREVGHIGRQDREGIQLELLITGGARDRDRALELRSIVFQMRLRDHASSERTGDQHPRRRRVAPVSDLAQDPIRELDHVVESELLPGHPRQAAC